MVNVTENSLSVIQQEDPTIKANSFLDFQLLRSNGLKHIGDLVGKIWTDHNAHDPGITMLEVLCYALIDLGYRTQSDMADLMAAPAEIESKLKDGFVVDDNFFTPLEILTCNPTTITDYRKLLLDVKGVRNAWLEPAPEQEVPLKINKDAAGKPMLTCSAQEEDIKIQLNGLYSILIEKEASVDEWEVNQELCKVLAAHRNLGEDFKEVTFLKPCDIGIEAEIKIKENAIVEQVYEKVLKAIQAYISPSIRYYSLQELLAKGKAIEDVFAGRPYRSDSFGFIDIEELEALPFRAALFASDIYREILNIAGVVAIRKFQFKSDIPPANPANSNIQRLCIPSGCVARFALDRTSIEMCSGQGTVQFDRTNAHKSLITASKSKMGRANLDLPIPQGNHYPELGDYLSIQHEFPLVYGIGPGGLPEGSSKLRQVQALQLKAYLLFFDQLLANYLAQVTNLRNLFSLQQESRRDKSTRRTYFSQVPKDVPGIEQLSLMYSANQPSNNTVIAIPVADNQRLRQQLQKLSTVALAELRVENHCGNVPNGLAHLSDPSKGLREIRIKQAIRDISQGDYTLEIYQDKAGYFFLIRFAQFSEWVLIGGGRYNRAAEAREMANLAIFLATMPDYYQKYTTDNNPGQVYRYDLVFNSIAYLAYLQHLLEDEQTYYQRREAFLDHLLARFSSHFTDYSLLRFGAKTLQHKELSQTIEDKSRFLSHFDDTSRNRGRAFDYLKRAWGTDNVSGYEKRIALLSGMKDWKRRNLCKFEVIPSNRVVLPDLNGSPWLSSQSLYDTTQEAEAALAQLIPALRNPAQYDDLQQQFTGFNPITVGRIFSELPTAENIVVAEHQYALQFKNAKGTILQSNQNRFFKNPEEAIAALPQLIQTINEQLKPDIELQEIAKQSEIFFNNKALRYEVLEQERQYKWYQQDGKGLVVATANSFFPSEAAALDDFVQNADFSSWLSPIESAFQWAMDVANGITLVSTAVYATEQEAHRGWLLCRSNGQQEPYYHFERAPLGGINVTLYNEKGFVLAEALIPAQQKNGPETFIKTCCAHFLNKETELKYPLYGPAYGWTINNDMGEPFLTSAQLYPDAKQAIFALRDTFNAGMSVKNYKLIGKEVLPGYCIFLFDSNGQYLATNPQTYFDSAKKRDKALSGLKKDLQKVNLPLEIRTENAQYSWSLLNPGNSESLLSSSQPFDSIQAADADFAQQLKSVLASSEQDSLAEHIYTIDQLEMPIGYSYVYQLNNTNGKALPWLKSEQHFETIAAAQAAYTQMMKAFPSLQFQGAHPTTVLTDAQQIGLQLLDDNEDNREQTKALLMYMQKWSQVSSSGTSTGKWISRALDKDNPHAKSDQIYTAKTAAEENLLKVCRFKPLPLDAKKQVLQVICPVSSPDRHHYTICLSDDEGKDYVFLTSYIGYDNKNQALEAGQAQWLQIIELATHPENYGVGKYFTLEEKYSTASNPCMASEPYLAVLSPEFTSLMGAQAVQKAVALSLRYPIRIKYKKDEAGKETAQIQGYTFHGYNLEENKKVWVSSVDYPSHQAAVQAHHLFTVLLRNSNNCRIACVEGKYQIQLLEILAESREFDTEDQAWGESVDQGILPFTQSAGDEKAYIHFAEGNGYRFNVVAPAYYSAKHTCDYPSAALRDAAMEQIFQWAYTFACKSYELTIGDVIQFKIGDGYYLEENISNYSFARADAETILLEWINAATDERNIEEQSGVWKLKNPFDRRQSFASIKRESGVVDKAEFVALARQYPIVKKGDAYYFRLYYPENGKLFDQALEPCDCEKKNDSGLPAPSFGGKAYVFESVHAYTNRNEAEDAFTHLCEHLLKDKQSYHPVQETGVGPFTFSIIDPSKVLAAHPNLHPDLNGSIQAAQRLQSCMNDDGLHLVEHILLRPTLPEQCSDNCLLSIPSDIDLTCQLLWEGDNSENESQALTYIPGIDPYSFQATLVLPRWYQRFKTPALRGFFLEMLHREAPALIGLNVLWLSPKQMCKFEAVFQDWLNWLRNPQLLCESADQPYCSFVEYLNELRDHSVSK